MRMVKNIALFPIETVILVVIFRALIPPFQRLGYIHSGTKSLEFTKKNIILLICLFVIGVGAVAGYSIYSYNTTSLSASYSSEERLARNRAIEIYVMEKHPDLTAEDTVCIIEAMKQMNELVAEEEGTLDEICVEDGQIVEYGTVLFRIKK